MVAKKISTINAMFPIFFFDNINQSRCIGVFLDLARVFDTVNHHILLYKLRRYGVKDNGLQLLKYYYYIDDLLRVTQFILLLDSVNFFDRKPTRFYYLSIIKMLSDNSRNLVVFRPSKHKLFVLDKHDVKRIERDVLSNRFG